MLATRCFGPGPVRVKGGKVQTEQIFSGLHLKADARRSREKNRALRNGSLVPDQAQSDRLAPARLALFEQTLQLPQHRVAFRRLVPGAGRDPKRLPARA